MPDVNAHAGDVTAVVVTFHPEAERTVALLEAVRPQVGHVVVVDNGSPEPLLAELRVATERLGCTLVDLGANRGIAAAQNVGIAQARRHGARFVLLSDQDSLPAPDMVHRLLEGMQAAHARAATGGRPPAAVGPVTVDERNAGAALLFSAHRWGPRRASVPDVDGQLVDATFLIASGSLVSVEALEVVGPMNEGWFIDHVDLEWGLRARAAGFTLYGVTGAHLEHALGDRTQRIPGRARDVHIHSPQRNYYMARNTVLLVRSGLLPVAWRWGYRAWITKYAAFYVLAVSPRGRRARFLARGFWDGVRGRTGEYAAGRPAEVLPAGAVR